MTMQDDLQHCLCGTLAELVDLVGVTATLAVVQRWGGIRLYVPSSPPSGHPLVETIGQEAADEIATAFPGERLEVPRASALVRELRDREIRAAYPDVSQAQLARHYGLTQRQIRTILSTADAPIGAEVDSRQVSLL